MFNRIYLNVMLVGAVVFGGWWLYAVITGSPTATAGGLFILSSLLYWQTKSELRLDKIEAWMRELNENGIQNIKVLPDELMGELHEYLSTKNREQETT